MEHTLLAVGGPSDGQIVTGYGDTTRVWVKPRSEAVLRMHGEAPPELDKALAEVFTYDRVWLTDTSGAYSAFWVPQEESFLWAVNQLAVSLKRKTLDRELAIQCHALIYMGLRHCAGPVQDHKTAMEKLRVIAEEGRD